MTLAFPNPSRSFDATVNCVRFCGHDNAIEVAFFVQMDALSKLSPGVAETEAGMLGVFDSELKKIHKTATRLYEKAKRVYVFTLTSDDF